jgi:hypothetical protein
MLDEMSFVVVEFVFPIDEVRREVDFFSSPETSLGFFVKAPDVVVLNREQDETAFIFFENRFV